MKLEFQEKVVPGDGNCLFHSLGLAFNKSQDNLRFEISNYLEKNRKLKLNGLTLEEWLNMEKDMKLEDYVKIIRNNGVWGGNMEINIASRIYKVNIFVLERDFIKKKYKVVSTYVHNNEARNIFLMYDGVHYNYMKVTKNLAGINI